MQRLCTRHSKQKIHQWVMTNQQDLFPSVEHFTDDQLKPSHPPEFIPPPNVSPPEKQQQESESAAPTDAQPLPVRRGFINEYFRNRAQRRL